MRTGATMYFLTATGLCSLAIATYGVWGQMLFGVAGVLLVIALLLFVQPEGRIASFIAKIPMLPLRFFLALFGIGTALIAQGTGYVIPGAFLVLFAYAVLLLWNRWYWKKAKKMRALT